MERDDALLALERHATSKIRSAADLVGVASFGFRGEALPAICSVCQPRHRDGARADGAGTAMRAAGGAVQRGARRRASSRHDDRRRRGCSTTRPARQKFLRGARSEWRGVIDAMTTIALTRRDVRFTALERRQDRAHASRRVESLRDRVAARVGRRDADRMVDVEDVRGAMHVSGLVERPGDVGTASRRTFVTVNGRPIRDSGLLRAAETAYRSTFVVRPASVAAARRSCSRPIAST